MTNLVNMKISIMKDTIEYVVNETYKNIEYITIDVKGVNKSLGEGELA
jgi:hypothetical protein